ncbi:MAG TPA: FUSC family protein [Bryobacteraceae bacterium]|nr:FUSC family protein [Bryobacteraceae bacterium]
MPPAGETTADRQSVASGESQTHPSPWSRLWQDVARFQSAKIDPQLALRNTIGLCLPLAGSAIAGTVRSGLAISTGALNVSFSDSDAPYRQRADRMLRASVLVGFAVLAGGISGHNNTVAVMTAALWAFGAGMLVALSTQAADLGAVSLVTLLVYAAIPLNARQSMSGAALAFCGGLLQTVLALAFWPFRRYAPERRALGELYLALSQAAVAPTPSTEAPPASAESTQAQTALSTLSRDHAVESERFQVLLSQAERIRLSLLALARLRVRVEREDPAGVEKHSLDRYLDCCARVLSVIGNALLADEPAQAAPECLQELQGLADGLHAKTMPQASWEPPQLTALRKDACFQMAALTGQLRSALELATHTSRAGLAAFERQEASRPPRLRLAGTLATLRANLHLQSAACRHAIRLSVCVAAGDALARGFELRRSYWLPMTVAIVLKSDFTATFTRGILRLAGTFLGLLLATGLFHLMPTALGGEIAAVTALMFVLRWLGPANYGILTAAVSALVVLLIAMTGVAPGEVIMARGVNTAAGGVIALLAYWLWPTWERTQVPEGMARMLDAYRDYFRVIREAYVHPDRSFSARLDRTRLAGRLARSNLEASIDRLHAEPGTSVETDRSLNSILASSHRLAHALMALEAGLYASHPAPAREAFVPFANDVELTLYYLAAALRGSPVARDTLPDLREDHYELVHSGDLLTGRYALVNVETDRITNSLNTLGEELLRWIGPGSRATG